MVIAYTEAVLPVQIWRKGVLCGNQPSKAQDMNFLLEVGNNLLVWETTGNKLETAKISVPEMGLERLTQATWSSQTLISSGTKAQEFKAQDSYEVLGSGKA